MTVSYVYSEDITIPRGGFDPPSAEVQTSTECEFDAFTLQATTAGLYKIFIDQRKQSIFLTASIKSFVHFWQQTTPDLHFGANNKTLFC